MPPTLFSAGFAELTGPFGLVLLPLLAGAAAVFLLLPRPKSFPALWGALTGVVALALAGWFVVGVAGFSVEAFLFYVFSGLALVFGVLLVTQRNPARAALSFAVVVLATCGLFLLLAAPFLMAATIIIYAGAIIVTFLFVLMLAQQEGPSDADARSREPLLAVAVGFLLLAALLYVLQIQWNGQSDAESRACVAMLEVIHQQRAGLSPDTVGRLTDFPTRVKRPLVDAINDADKHVQLLREEGKTQEARAAKDQLDSLTYLRGQVEAVTLNDWPSATPDELPQLQNRLARLETTLYQIKQQRGWPRPNEPNKDQANALSSFSGPPPNLPLNQMRVDPENGGRPYLPADNPAYLGKSLFTDYLLPVELGGFLLLIAVIGAVAIAQRRSGTEATP
jgi:NADH:ubiquinone oxidoreductase subunit 6 (subunit J)